MIEGMERNAMDDLSPYLISVRNMSYEDTKKITSNSELLNNSIYLNDYLNAIGCSHEINDLESIMFMENNYENVQAIVNFFNSIGIEVICDHEAGKEFLFKNQNSIIDACDNITFLVVSGNYIYKNFDVDDVLDKILENKELSGMDKVILEEKTKKPN